MLAIDYFERVFGQSSEGDTRVIKLRDQLTRRSSPSYRRAEVQKHKWEFGR